jgi:histidine ammonia-lyase
LVAITLLLSGETRFRERIYGFTLCCIAEVVENKTLAIPASNQSLPASAGMEDLNSMGPLALQKWAKVLRNTRRILGRELLAASQAYELIQREGTALKTSEPLERVLALIRSRIPFHVTDKDFIDDQVAMDELIMSGALLEAAGIASAIPA